MSGRAMGRDLVESAFQEGQNFRLTPPAGTAELPANVIRDASKRGSLGLTSTSLLLMHPGEWLVKRNRTDQEK